MTAPNVPLPRSTSSLNRPRIVHAMYLCNLINNIFDQLCQPPFFANSSINRNPLYKYTFVIYLLAFTGMVGASNTRRTHERMRKNIRRFANCVLIGCTSYAGSSGVGGNGVSLKTATHQPPGCVVFIKSSENTQRHVSVVRVLVASIA